MRLVVDMSALRGASFANFRSLSEIHDLWLPEAIFYEALTTDSAKNRAKCFALIQHTARRPSLTTNTGKLLALELQQRLPIDPVSGDWSGVTWPWHKSLADEANDLGEFASLINPWKNEIRQNILAFTGVVSDVTAKFPSLGNLKGGGTYGDVEDLLQLVASHPSFTREVYSAAVGADGPAAGEIGPEWMAFRVFQAAFLNAIEHVRKYGGAIAGTTIPKQVENSYLDMEYMTIATFADGIISADSRLVDLHKMLKVDTRVFTSIREALFLSCGA